MSKLERAGQVKLPLVVVHHKHRNNLLHNCKYLCNIFTSLFKIYIFPFSLALTVTVRFRSKEPTTSITSPTKETEQ